MPAELRLHIGPFKTGSTSIQQTLVAARSQLSEAGVLYPRVKDRSYSHQEPVCGFLVQAGLTTGPPVMLGLQTYLRSNPGPKLHAWRDLNQQISAHAGPALISAEMLASLPGEAVKEFLDVLAVRPVQVVMVQRRASRLLPSWYQETAKMEPVADFETFARAAIADLLRDEITPSSFLNTGEVAARWADAGCDVHVVDARNCLDDQVLNEALSLLVPETALTVRRHSNPGMSAVGTRLWQAYSQLHPFRLRAVGRSLRRRLTATFDIIADPELGGRLALTERAAATLDACVKGPGDAQSLHALIDGYEPVTRTIPGSTTLDEAQRRETFTHLRRWHHLEEARWGAVDLGVRASGRCGLTPSPFTGR